MKNYSVPLLDWREVVFETVTVQATNLEEAWDKAAAVGEHNYADDFICVDQLGTVEVLVR